MAYLSSPLQFTVPRESERKHPTQHHVKPHPIAASSPISSSQRKVIAVSAETATRSSPGPQGGFREPSSITHPTQPHGNRHCIAVSAPIPSGHRQVPAAPTLYPSHIPHECHPHTSVTRTTDCRACVDCPRACQRQGRRTSSEPLWL
ncbi:hypothetical protein JB92DRAFT_1647778 [Gautieria morchelliformis]|nr:hypothetical protein JB92DRAFT_1647778 [Gautieria morchelliformis]